MLSLAAKRSSLRDINITSLIESLLTYALFTFLMLSLIEIESISLLHIEV